MVRIDDDDLWGTNNLTGTSSSIIHSAGILEADHCVLLTMSQETWYKKESFQMQDNRSVIEIRRCGGYIKIYEVFDVILWCNVGWPPIEYFLYGVVSSHQCGLKRCHDPNVDGTDGFRLDSQNFPRCAALFYENIASERPTLTLSIPRLRVSDPRNNQISTKLPVLESARY